MEVHDRPSHTAWHLKRERQLLRLSLFKVLLLNLSVTLQHNDKELKKSIKIKNQHEK